MQASRTPIASVAVIIPAFNRERLVVDAIENVLRQECHGCEIIVVDDGSTDGTAAAALRHPGVRVLTQSNGGPAAARNLGISNTCSDYIAFLDSDDLWEPAMLTRLVEELERDPALDVALGLPQLARINSSGVGHDIFGDHHSAFTRSISGTVFRRKVFSKVGLFDPDLRFGEDADWFCRAQEIGINISKLNILTVTFRRHEDNMTKGKGMVDLNLLRVFKKSLDRKRSPGNP